MWPRSEGTGAVLLYRGGAATPSGLNPASPIQLDETSPHVPGTARAWDQFGSSLAAGDLNGDGRADLAVGVPGRAVGGKAEAGAVFVFNGCAGGSSCNGLVSTDGEDFKLNELAGRNSQTAALFGLSLAIGDFGRNGAQDLAIGVPGYNVKGVKGAGAVAILYSTGPAGLSVTDYTFIVEGAGGVPGAPGALDNFGNSLVAGNLGKTAQAELAIGTPFKTVTSGSTPLARAGQVHVLYGAPEGLTTAGIQHFTQASPGIPGDLTDGGGFGKAMLIANFAGGSVGQLAIASRDTVDGQVHAGGVHPPRRDGRHRGHAEDAVPHRYERQHRPPGGGRGTVRRHLRPAWPDRIRTGRTGGLAPVSGPWVRRKTRRRESGGGPSARLRSRVLRASVPFRLTEKCALGRGRRCVATGKARVRCRVPVV